MTEPQLYRFGPCEPWTPIWNCRIDEIVGAPEVTGVAVEVASEVLYMLTAQRFSTCTVKLRPCRRACYAAGFPWSDWWTYGQQYPYPYWWRGAWYNLGCAANCGDTCSCPALDETILPGPVESVVEVKVDGVILTPGTDYRIDDYRRLVRVNGLWPVCQDMNLDDDQPNTWSATVRYGEPVPVLGQLAVGELAIEIIKYLLCDDTCALPQGVVDISRQGISMTVTNIAEIYQNGLINLRMCDLFIQTTNPNHLRARAYVYDLDNPQHRAWGTAGLT